MYTYQVHNIVISGALQPMQKDFFMSTRQKELVVSATTFGAIFSGFFAGLVSRIAVGKQK